MNSIKRHFYYFNAFRVLAALIVLTCHARCEIFETYSQLNLASQNIFTRILFAGLSFTDVAMSIFFVLSGFLVGGPTLEKLYQGIGQQTTQNENTRMVYNYTINRFIRIIPPLFVAIIFSIIVKLVGHVDFSWWDAFLNLLGLQGVCASDFGGVYWSMAYEIWFYVLIGAVLCVFSRKCMFLGIILLMVTGFVFITLPIRWFLTMCFGVILYFAKGFSLKRWQIVSLLFVILVAHIIGMLSAESHAFVFPLHGVLNPEYPEWVVTICVALLIVSVCQIKPNSKFTMKIESFGNKWAPFTYALYITHFSVLELNKHLFGKIADIDCAAFLVYFVVCSVCLLVGYVFYNLIEVPFVYNLKSKLYSVR